MRISLLPCLFLLLPMAACPAAEAPATRRNVVLLFADDWRHDTLGCAGHPIVRTPNLDRLAAEGVRFTRNCVTTSICGVSRASVLTGQWMSRHGNEAFREFKTPWADTYAGRLRAAGYHVGHVGKWHNGKFPAEEFDFARSYAGTHWMKQAGGGRIHVTRRNENDALEFLRTRPADKPFCLTVAFFATHAEDGHPKQFLPQEESMTWYCDITVPVPENATDASFQRLPPFLANEKNEGRRRWHWRFDEPAKYQEMMKNYYRLATEVDAVCGKVVDELARQNVLGETLVIFTTDNGYFHGEHGLADKWYPYEESIRTPMIVRDPRLPSAKRGLQSDAFTLNVDIAPTMLAAAGVPAPAGMQGRDIAPLYLAEAPPSWRQDFFYEHAIINHKDFIPASQALVERTWKYLYWPDFGREQLFHLQEDPREEHDLAGDPAQAARMETMRKRFRELRDAAR